MLINATCYENGKKLFELSKEQLLSFAPTENQFFWAAVADPTEEELKLLFSKVKVHELAYEDLVHGNQISKVEEYDEDLFVVLKQIKLTEGELSFGDVYVFAGENYVISIRKGVGEPLTATRALVEKNTNLLKKGSGYVLYAIIDTVVDRYFPVIALLQKEIDLLEDQIFQKADDKSKEQLIEKLHNFKRNLREVQNAINPLLDSVHKLFGGRVPDICEGLDNYFRDTYDHLTRIDNSLDNLAESANATIQTNVALITIEENKITKKLAAWAAIFATVTFLAGIWGMNFAHMPEINWKYGYPFALSVMVLVVLGLRYKFKKVGWL